ncbi:unnamed protein product [Brassica napus]|uniref:(rape) hypothetical protein n=1 Tax=Brassica napus TaxID=3708 RepID=A0A816TMR8_BRANA|nr:unnamed protein product [Brassica napus]
MFSTVEVRLMLGGKPRMSGAVGTHGKLICRYWIQSWHKPHGGGRSLLPPFIVKWASSEGYGERLLVRR